MGLSLLRPGVWFNGKPRPQRRHFISSFVASRNSQLRGFVTSNRAFSRHRKLTLENVVGHILHMALDRNQNGYEILSQEYFHSQPNSTLNGVARSSLTEARAKLPWQAFEYLVHELQDLPELHAQRWYGHRVWAVDGSHISLPHCGEVLSQFPLSTCQQNRTHFPKAVMVTAVDVFSGVPLGFELEPSPKWSERAALRRMLDQIHSGDVLLLDRGFDGYPMMNELNDRGLHFVLRMRTDRSNSTKIVRDFIASGKKSALVEFSGTRQLGQPLSIRLIRSFQDRDGSPLVIATNLSKNSIYTDSEMIQLYLQRWNVETMYARVKSLLRLEYFHARTLNGVLQEIWANLFVLGLSAYLAMTGAEIQGMPLERCQPNLKNVTVVVRRNLVRIVHGPRHRKRIERILYELLEQILDLTVERRPGRRCARICKRPTSKWTRLSNKNKPRNPAQKRRWAEKGGFRVEA